MSTPSELTPLLLSSSATGYQIERSLRFNSPDTAYLNRTPASATNQKTWTWSAWVKRSVLGATKVLFDARGAGSNPVHAFYFNSSDQLAVFIRNASATVIGSYNTSAVFRDPSAWYHITYKFDSTQATATNRVQIYVNGVLQSITASTTISQNADAFINSAISHGIGAEGVTPTDEFDGYMTEVNFVDSPVLVGSTTNASTTVTLTTGTTTNIGIGWSVGGTNIPSGATVSSITNSTQFVISAAATATGSSISIGVAPPVSAFGETDSNTGVWKPKAYTGTYGTNGFFLKFADNSGTTSTTLGKDSSGNGNNWTPNLFSVTPGIGNDSLVDSPTSYGTDTGAGGEVRGNYATLNSLTFAGSGAFLTNGNLDYRDATGSASWKSRWSTIAPPSSGKWYAEFDISYSGSSALNGLVAVGLHDGLSSTTYVGQSATSYGFFGNGNKYNNGSSTATGVSYGNGDRVQVAYDADNGNVWFGKGNVWIGSGNPSTGANPAYTGVPKNLFIGASVYWITPDGITWVYCNFGQRPFAYTAPSGFKALCTQNLPTPTIGATSTTQANDYFNVKTYTGTGTQQSLTGVGFQPDFIWFKSRSTAVNHALIDAVRGRSKLLFSSLTDAEATSTTTAKDLVSFDADGFTVGVPEQNGSINTNGTTNVAWNWKANGVGVTNNDGNITSTVSASTTSGFSIVTYTGNGSANQTVGHGLGVAPAFGFLKDRDSNSNNNQWQVFHTAAGDKYGYFTTAAFAGTAQFYPTSGSSTTVTVGRDLAVNTNESGDRFVMYLFAPVAGYSAFGSYTGNGSADGPFVYTGFRPRWLLRKRYDTGTTSDWQLIDTAREEYNPDDSPLWPNLSNAQSPDPAFYVDMLSNGFKLRGTTASTNLNTNGGTYIYAAFAESPFKYSLAR